MDDFLKQAKKPQSCGLVLAMIVVGYRLLGRTEDGRIPLVNPRFSDGWEPFLFWSMVVFFIGFCVQCYRGTYEDIDALLAEEEARLDREDAEALVESKETDD